MSKRLLLFSQMNNTVSSDGDVAEQPSVNQPVKVTDCQVITNNNCIYKLDRESKKFYVWIVGVIRDTNNYKAIITVLHSLDKDYEVHIYIHSPGGSISTACNILLAMERCKALIITHNIGMAASCGSLILAFGDKINVYDNAITMFHNSSYGNLDATHRMIMQTQHIANNTMHLFTLMKDRGIMTEDEITNITKRGEEYYLTSAEMRLRLTENNLWYGEQV